MRLDKFLKVSRIIKRRTLAKEACENGQTFVNGRVAKAGSEIRVGDQITLKLGSRLIKFEVVQIRETVPAKEASTLYRLLETTYSEPEDDIE